MSGHEEQPSDGGLPVEIEIYFPDFAALDLSGLAKFIAQCEAGGENVEVVAVEDEIPAEPGVRVAGFVASIGDINAGVVLMSTPTPNIELIRLGAITDEAKEVLAGHKAHALLTLVGGEDEAPIERLLFAYKIVAGLCMQGAIGMSNVHTERVLPAEVLRELFAAPAEEGEQSIWDLLRTSGEPAELLMSIEKVEVDGREYLATCGLGYCDLPDLVWEYRSDDEADNVIELFRNCFTYMMENNTALEAGELIDGGSQKYRLLDVPEGWELPYPNEGALLMTKA